MTGETAETVEAIEDAENAAQRHAALVALGKQIRKARTEQGISQEDFAAKAGLGRSYYGGIERGERNVAALNLMRIALALNIEVGKLFPPVTEFAPHFQGDGSESPP